MYILVRTKFPKSRYDVVFLSLSKAAFPVLCCYCASYICNWATTDNEAQYLQMIIRYIRNQYFSLKVRTEQKDVKQAVIRERKQQETNPSDPLILLDVVGCTLFCRRVGIQLFFGEYVSETIFVQKQNFLQPDKLFNIMFTTLCATK